MSVTDGRKCVETIDFPAAVVYHSCAFHRAFPKRCVDIEIWLTYVYPQGDPRQPLMKR